MKEKQLSHLANNSKIFSIKLHFNGRENLRLEIVGTRRCLFGSLVPRADDHIFDEAIKQKGEIDGGAPETACENKETTLRKYFVSKLI